MSSTSSINSAAINSLLDVSLDDIADLPEFMIFPAGAHRCTISFEAKQIGTHPAVEAKLVLLETVELANPSDSIPKEGSESNVAYMLDNEYGQGNLKKLLKPLAAHLGLSQVPKILEESNGTEVLVVTRQRQNKEKTQTYLDIVSLQVM